MWARRIGLRPQWPSRMRVFALSCGSISIGLVIYQYLSSMTTSDLDLREPVYGEILCLSHWPAIGSDGWFDQGAWFNWSRALLNRESYVKDFECRFTSNQTGPGSYAKQTCDQVKLPIETVDQPLGLALGEGSTSYHIILTGFAYVFLWVGVWLCISLLWHDLCMCTHDYKDKVRDLRGVYDDFYFGIWLLTRPSGLMAMRRLRSGDYGKVGAILCWVILPVWLSWAIPYSMFLWWPFAGLLFLVKPVALCRISVFTVSFFFSLYLLAATVLSMVMLVDKSHRPMYAVTFESTSEDVTCSCGCVYRLNWNKSVELLVVSLGATLQCLFKGWLTLKGLRNSNWATLLTVKFPVPLNVYPVQWTREDDNSDYVNGEPIQFRDEVTPVQAEVAFDPFALMDEQRDSQQTWCSIRPSKVLRPSSSQQREQAAGEDGTGRSKNFKLAGPVATRSSLEFGNIVEDKDFCCGFACVKFGTRAAPSSDDDDEGDRGDQSREATPSSPVFSAQQEAADGLVARLLEAPELAGLSQERRSGLRTRLAPLLAQELGTSV